jgi:hypothetical protein
VRISEKRYMPQDPLPEPGEFTRIFKRRHLAAQGADAQAEASSLEGSNVQQPEMPPPQAAAAQPPKQPMATGAESGEFTRYFAGGLPPHAPKGGGASPRMPAGVQRPNTPVPPRTLAGDNNSNFTARFREVPAAPQVKADEHAVHNPPIGPAPDLGKPPLTEDNGPFDFKPKVPQPLPSRQDEPSEYTALFGRGDRPPSPNQSAVAQAPLAPMMSDSARAEAATSLDAPTRLDMPGPSAEAGPSEFTMIANGRPAAPENAVAEGSSLGTTGRNSTAAIGKLPFNVNVSPLHAPSLGGGGTMPSLGMSGSAGMSGANAATPLGSVSAQAPHIQAPHLQAPHVSTVKVPDGGKGLSGLSGRTKLILFFALLATLAVVLVVALAITQKN